ncbi:Na+/H+ antiporter subunit E [Litoreibacter roseus]|uniref:Cation:proton antiporter n=1 Tax=Litoreibacter roseus TaxID=2601869 RepID=A0A6N6JEB1_9RHOB|nr:Na+/H+ antiporter subunit E [Litoreibacter roseus]GFE64170.1 cation:proton antiporter [Litoreibacter roseus]
MNTFTTNILLAACWAALAGSLSLFTLFTGFVLGYVILWVLQPLIGGTDRYFLRVYYWVRLVVMFHYELVVSSVQVIWDVLTPRHLATPMLIDVPLDVKTDAGILLVTNLISLTPGTLSIDVSDDKKTLLVHAMFADDPDEIRQQLKNGMERWVREAIED